MAHKIVPKNCSVKIRCLERETSDEIISFRQLTTMTFKTIDEIENGVYCHPINKNFESVDAVIAPNIFFQITVAEKHPVLQAGFRQLLEKFQISPDNKAQLYFIVPDYLFNKFRKQPYITKKKDESVKFNDWINKRVIQHVACLKEERFIY